MKLSLAIIVLYLFLIPLQAYQHNCNRVDAHAPISVMGDHIHKKKEWMLSYRFIYMDMKGMRSGSNRLSSQAVFTKEFAITPERMIMNMHMLGGMYAFSDRLTIIAMVPYTQVEMDHRLSPMAISSPLGGMKGHPKFSTKSKGLGDIKLTALYQFWQSNRNNVHFGLGFSLPSGSISEKDSIPVPGGFAERQMPAPMQLGSGTLDVMPSITLLSQYTDWSYGMQLSGIIRTHKNHHNYRLGDVAKVNIWSEYLLSNWVAPTLRLEYKYQGEMDGQQSNLTLSPPFDGRSINTAFSENYGGHTANLGAGLNILFPENTPFQASRLAFEFNIPFYQDLNGIQLETDYSTIIGWQNTW